MKNPHRLLLGLAALIAMTACDAFRTLSNDGTTSLGRPYELIVVCDQKEWDGAVGDTLRHLFHAPVAYINQEEPLFDLMRVTQRGFSKMVTLHRNILRVEIDPAMEAEEVTSASAKYNLRSAPQIEVTLRGQDTQAILEYLDQHGKELIQVFEQAERERATDYAAKFNEKHIGSVIKQTFGIDMTVPRGYVLAKQESDFIWCRYEYPAASQGFSIYSYPYLGKGSLNEKTLLAARNKFANRIPGPSDGSHMTTSEAFEPDIQAFRLDGRAWIEMRGFWDVAGDFMGGPFVSYTTIDTTTNRVITLDCYIFSPKLDKRNFLRGVEHLLHLVKIPDQEAK